MCMTSPFSQIGIFLKCSKFLFAPQTAKTHKKLLVQPVVAIVVALTTDWLSDGTSKWVERLSHHPNFKKKGICGFSGDKFAI